MTAPKTFENLPEAAGEGVSFLIDGETYVYTKDAPLGCTGCPCYSGPSTGCIPCTTVKRTRDFYVMPLVEYATMQLEQE